MNDHQENQGRNHPYVQQQLQAQLRKYLRLKTRPRRAHHLGRNAGDARPGLWPARPCRKGPMGQRPENRKKLVLAGPGFPRGDPGFFFFRGTRGLMKASARESSSASFIAEMSPFLIKGDIFPLRRPGSHHAFARPQKYQLASG